MGVGAEFDYDPGTVVVVGGRMLVHEVTMHEGERICYAYYMRSSLFEYTQQMAPMWMTEATYQPAGHT